MSKFILIPRDRPEAFDALSPEDMEGVLDKYNSWTGKMQEAGRLLGGDKLKDREGRVLTGTGARTVVTDGPYSETKEVVGGYWLIDADNYEHAVELASDNPHLEFGTLEIRAIDVV